jgi:hypothetical protein
VLNAYLTHARAVAQADLARVVYSWEARGPRLALKRPNITDSERSVARSQPREYHILPLSSMYVLTPFLK